jgi:hypothetical protein
MADAVRACLASWGCLGGGLGREGVELGGEVGDEPPRLAPVRRRDPWNAPGGGVVLFCGVENRGRSHRVQIIAPGGDLAPSRRS